MKYINMSIVCWFHNFFFIILDIEVALISYSLSKATSKIGREQSADGLMSPHSAPCWQYPS